MVVMATLLGNCTEKGTETLMEGSSTEVNTAVDATGEFRASQVELVGRTLGKVRVKDRGLGSPPPMVSAEMLQSRVSVFEYASAPRKARRTWALEPHVYSTSSVFAQPMAGSRT